MSIRYPAPLQAGDKIAVTAPSAPVPDELWPRLQFAIRTLEEAGYEVVLGECLRGDGLTSAPPHHRAHELRGFLQDPDVRVVVPPWGGDLAVELLPHLELETLDVETIPWLVGFSDTSTLMLALSCATGVASLHSQNLLDTPYRVPPPLRSWLEVASLPTGSTVSQGPSTRHRAHGFDRWEDDPTPTEYRFDTSGTWQLLHPDRGPLHASGRLMGGCIETISTLAGTAFGDLPTFAQRYAPDGLVLYLEADHDDAAGIARHLWRMRLAGWFDHANAVLLARTNAPEAEGGFTHHDAVRSALTDLDVPVAVDVDCGHLPPQLALVNGARAEITFDGAHRELTQHLR